MFGIAIQTYLNFATFVASDKLVGFFQDSKGTTFVISVSDAGEFAIACTEECAANDRGRSLGGIGSRLWFGGLRFVGAASVSDLNRLRYFKESDNAEIELDSKSGAASDCAFEISQRGKLGALVRRVEGAALFV